MKIRISRDTKGISYWPGDVKLDFHRNSKGECEFFDDDCNVRGTENPFDLVDMLLGDEDHVNLAVGEYIEVECSVSKKKTLE